MDNKMINWRTGHMTFEENEKLFEDFPKFLKNIGKEDQVKYSESIIMCDSDKCDSYRYIWEKNGIPFNHGVMIYLITKMNPYCKETRVSISALDFVIEHYEEFKPFLQ